MLLWKHTGRLWTLTSVKTMPREKPLYVIVRKDMPKSAQAVQGGHALAQFLLTHNTEWKNGTLVYLAARNEEHLSEIKNNLGEDKLLSEFREPDMANSLTAIAVFGRESYEVSEFPTLSLL